MEFVDLPGVRTCFDRSDAGGGEGSRLVVLNGTGSDLRHEPSPLKWPIAEGRNVVALDHRGLGQSEPTDPEYQPTMADFANDVLALADHVGWERFDLLGVSFGGMVAQEVAIRGGERIQRMILACTSTGGVGRPSFPLHEIYNQAGDKIDADMVGLLDERAAEPGPFRDRLVEAMSTRARPAVTPPGLLKQLEARRWHDTWDRLGTITARTLVAAGKYDGIAPLGNCEALAGQIPDAELRVYEGGHLFMYQDRSAYPDFATFLER